MCLGSCIYIKFEEVKGKWFVLIFTVCIDRRETLNIGAEVSM